MTEPKKPSKVARYVGIAGIVIVVGFSLLICFAPDSKRTVSPSDRRIFAETIEDVGHFPRGTVTIRGEDDDVMVIDATGCNYNELVRLAHAPRIKKDLTDLDFKEIRCADGAWVVMAPWNY